MSTLITNGTVLTFGDDKRVLPYGAVYYEGDTIVEVGRTADLEQKYPTAERIEARGKIVMPGMVCAHTHFYGGFARGMAIPGQPPKNFMQVLEQLWWKVDRALTLEDSKYTALVALVDAIRHGTTTVIDHHASPTHIDGSLDALAEAATDSGLRVGLCYEVTDRNGPQGTQAGIDENVRFIKKLRANPNPKLGASFGLHASFTVGEQTLQACLDASRGLDTGFHIHVAEDKADQLDSLQKYNKRVGERLEDEGVLGPKTLVAHAIHVDAFEMQILKQSQTKISHQPRSNMNNAVGVAQIETMLDKGITVGLGNDGFSNNMFTEIHTAYLLHKSYQEDPRAMPGDRLMEMAFNNNAIIAEIFFPKQVASLIPGAYADIIMLDYLPYTPLTDGNYPWHLIFGMDGSRVTHTICGGQLLMKDRQLLTLDEAKIAAHAKELAPKIWKRVDGM
ncbi:putative aminohydrolase SsnA [Anaerolineales bacterium HSG24]|nr:putative aminohydrolase SsnA [Anaerolineales bacterium HSG24]